MLEVPKVDEQWHAHQGLDHPRLVGAYVYYSPWVMPGRSALGVHKSVDAVRKSIRAHTANRVAEKVAF